MNYEQKYKEALERMKSWVKGEHPECFCEAQKAAEFIFPELKEKESDDERIRKGLIRAFGTIGKKDWGGLIVRDILDWLEKQSEHNPFDTHPQDRWISVKDELPHGGVYLFCNSNGDVFIASDEIAFLYKNVTHWMPLPPAPKKGGEQ